MEEAVKRHAYLIVAHDKLDQLLILLECLDDARNDIYIHVDKKVNEYKIWKSKLMSHVVHSAIFIFQEYAVNWGGVFPGGCYIIPFENSIF